MINFCIGETQTLLKWKRSNYAKRKSVGALAVSLKPKFFNSRGWAPAWTAMAFPTSAMVTPESSGCVSTPNCSRATFKGIDSVLDMLVANPCDFPSVDMLLLRRSINSKKLFLCDIRITHRFLGSSNIAVDSNANFLPNFEFKVAANTFKAAFRNLGDYIGSQGLVTPSHVNPMIPQPSHLWRRTEFIGLEFGRLDASFGK